MQKFVLVALIITIAECAAVATLVPAAIYPTNAPLPTITKTIPFPVNPVANATPITENHIVYMPGSTQKICQLIGDIDWETGQPTAARTFTNFGLDAADLGYPVEHLGKLILLFGDSWPPPHPLNETPLQSEVPPDDSVGVTIRTALPNASDGKCLELVINHDASKKFIPATITGPIQVKQGFFNVPSGGVSVAGSLFAFFWTNHCVNPNPLSPSQHNPLARPAVNPATDCPETDVSNSVGTNVMAQSFDDGLTFSHVVSMPNGFVYASAVNTRLLADLPADQRLGVFVFGVPRYRASIPYLAFASAQSFADPASWHFFSGLDANGQPEWVTSDAWQQHPATPNVWNPPGEPELFAANSNADRCVGELSVTWNSALGKWLMLYGCWQGMVVRIASAPWGPWSAPVTILGRNSGGGCKWVMTPDGCGSRRDFWPKLPNGKDVGGSFYAPFVLNRYTTAASSPTGARVSIIYWLVSTWNPYEVNVMQSTLEVETSSMP